MGKEKTLPGGSLRAEQGDQGLRNSVSVSHQPRPMESPQHSQCQTKLDGGISLVCLQDLRWISNGYVPKETPTTGLKTDSVFATVKKHQV